MFPLSLSTFFSFSFCCWRTWNGRGFWAHPHSSHCLYIPYLLSLIISSLGAISVWKEKSTTSQTPKYRKRGEEKWCTWMNMDGYGWIRRLAEKRSARGEAYQAFSHTLSYFIFIGRLTLLYPIFLVNHAGLFSYAVLVTSNRDTEATMCQLLTVWMKFAIILFSKEVNVLMCRWVTIIFVHFHYEQNN